MKNFGDMVKQAQEVQRRMTELQEALAAKRYEASAGGGRVKAVVDGRQMLKEITISPEALEEGDASLLEDLVIAAVGEAQRASAAEAGEAMAKLTGGLKLPF